MKDAKYLIELMLDHLPKELETLKVVEIWENDSSSIHVQTLKQSLECAVKAIFGLEGYAHGYCPIGVFSTFDEALDFGLAVEKQLNHEN